MLRPAPPVYRPAQCRVRQRQLLTSEGGGEMGDGRLRRAVWVLVLGLRFPIPRRLASPGFPKWARPPTRWCSAPSMPNSAAPSKTLAGGRAGPSVVISTTGWRRLRMEGYPWVRGGAALDAGHTHNPLTRQFAELRLTELERQIGTATAAIRRGEVRRKSHHSRWLGTNFRATPESSCQDVPLGSSWAHLSRLMATGDRVDDRGGRHCRIRDALASELIPPARRANTGRHRCTPGGEDAARIHGRRAAARCQGAN
jgi:hypothetical protein